MKTKAQIIIVMLFLATKVLAQDSVNAFLPAPADIYDQTTGEMNSESVDSNKPVPYTGYQVVAIDIPDNSMDVVLKIVDFNGNKVEELQVNEKGHVLIPIDTSTFTKTLYYCIVIVDGQEYSTLKLSQIN